MAYIKFPLYFQAYLFNDYWEDIGTIKSFFDANLALTEQVGVIVITLIFYLLNPKSDIPSFCISLYNV